MDNIDIIKLKKLLKLHREVQPKTYIDELAESGMLDDYLSNFFKTKIETDSQFKEKVFDAYYNYSGSVNENLEIYYLETICESLSFFIEYIQTCKTHRQ